MLLPRSAFEEISKNLSFGYIVYDYIVEKYSIIFFKDVVLRKSF